VRATPARLGCAASLDVTLCLLRPRDQIRDFIQFFIGVVDNWGPLGYAAYGLTYTVLEVLAVPAVPLTMTAGGHTILHCHWRGPQAPAGYQPGVVFCLQALPT
jgi:hypothetical protein